MHDIKYVKKGPRKSKPKTLPEKLTYKPLYLICIDIYWCQKFLELTGLAESLPRLLRWCSAINYDFVKLLSILISRGQDLNLREAALQAAASTTRPPRL